MACVEAIETALQAASGIITTPMWRSVAADRQARRLYLEQLALALDAAAVSLAA